MRLATGAGIREGGVGGNLRATAASSSCQVQASTQDRTIFLPAVQQHNSNANHNWNLSETDVLWVLTQFKVSFQVMLLSQRLLKCKSRVGFLEIKYFDGFHVSFMT